MLHRGQIPTDAALLPSRVWLRDEPEVSLVRPALVLTLYLDEAHEWAMHHAEATARLFVSRVRPTDLRWFTTSSIAQWRHLPPEEMEEVLSSISARTLLRRARHLLRVRLADDHGAPSLGFVYREVDPSLTSALPYVQITLPQTTPSDELLAFAIELAQTVPFSVGVAGWSFSWNPLFPKNCFTTMFGLLKRFVGVDVQHPERTAWIARDVIPGPAWLTLVSNAAAERMGLDRGELLARSWASEVTVLPLQRSLLIRAGERPMVGDLNLMEYPHAMAEASAVLARHYPEEPPALPGRFEREEGSTLAWMQRLVSPEGW